MKNKLKAITAVMLLTLNSAMSYLVFCYTYLLIAGATYYRFDKYALAELLFGVQIGVTYIFTYLSSITYLCKQLCKVKKWMVIIPILYSILVVVLSIIFIWWDYQLF